MTIWYLLDQQDQIVEVGGDFQRFAQENQGGANLATEVVGRSLWNFIQGKELRHLLRLLFQQAEAGVIKVPLRCDAPHELRLLEMQITAVPPYRRVLFQPLRIQPQPSPSPAPDLLRPEQPITLCAWCNSIEVTNGLSHWLPVDEAAQVLGFLVNSPGPLTHGLCPACSAALSQPDNAEGFQHLQRGLTPPAAQGS